MPCKEGDPTTINRTIEQHQAIVGAVSSMFEAAIPRLRWEGLYRFDGVGSCAHVDKDFSQFGLPTGGAKKAIIKLREERNAEFGGESTISPCPYHRAEHGCVLRDLKGGMCGSHFEAPWEWKKFGVDGYELHREIGTVLSKIHVEEGLENPNLAVDFTKKIQSITEHIKTFPLVEDQYLPMPRYETKNERVTRLR